MVVETAQGTGRLVSPHSAIMNVKGDGSSAFHYQLPFADMEVMVITLTHSRIAQLFEKTGHNLSVLLSSPWAGRGIFPPRWHSPPHPKLSQVLPGYRKKPSRQQATHARVAFKSPPCGARVNSGESIWTQQHHFIRIVLCQTLLISFCVFLPEDQNFLQKVTERTLQGLEHTHSDLHIFPCKCTPTCRYDSADGIVGTPPSCRR